MPARFVTWVRYPRRRRRKRLAKKIAKAGGMRLKVLRCVRLPFRTDVVAVSTGCTFYTDLP